MLIWEGTMFLNRDTTSPGPVRRYFAGLTPLEVFLDDEQSHWRVLNPGGCKV